MVVIVDRKLTDFGAAIPSSSAMATTTQRRFDRPPRRFFFSTFEQGRERILKIDLVLTDDLDKADLRVHQTTRRIRPFKVVASSMLAKSSVGRVRYFETSESAMFVAENMAHKYGLKLYVKVVRDRK